ncbi:hypothetical protein ACLOJK_029067 [Asimina triloba]
MQIDVINRQKKKDEANRARKTLTKMPLDKLEGDKEEILTELSWRPIKYKSS